MFHICQISSPVIWILHIFCFRSTFSILRDIFTDNVNMACPPILPTSYQTNFVNRIVAYSFSYPSSSYQINGFIKSIDVPPAIQFNNSFNPNFRVVSVNGQAFSRYYSVNFNSSSNNWRIYNSRNPVTDGFNFTISGSYSVRLDDICIFQVCRNGTQFDSKISKCTDACYYKNCYSLQNCNVVEGKAVCSCPASYKLDSDGSTCLIDPCYFKSCYSSDFCNSVSGYAVCSCPSNYKLQADESTCVQVVSPSQEPQNNKITVIIIAILVPVFVIIFVILCVVVVFLRRKKSRSKPPMQNPFLQIIENNNIPKTETIADEWEIFPENFIIGKKIGEGAYGNVFVAKIKANVLSKTMYAYRSGANLPVINEDSTCNVAVKLLKDGASQLEIDDFRAEINLMKSIGYHQNIVNMFGCSSVQKPLCLLVEFMDNGDLLQFLRNRRTKLHFPNVNGRPSVSIIYSASYQQSIERAVRRETSKNSGNDIISNAVPMDDIEVITPDDLLSFAWQVASGMEFLTKIKLVHRDLAARNVLVGAKNKVKISDFGLSRKIHYELQYIGSKIRRMPVKWMSLEAIVDQVFTTYSDVWAYGILLFEIVTLGGTPYPTLSNRELLSFLKADCRMDRPENCSSLVYDIMLHCWNKDPLQRPTFTELRQHLEQIISQGGRYFTFDVNEENPYYNVPSFNSIPSETGDDVQQA